MEEIRLVDTSPPVPSARDVQNQLERIVLSEHSHLTARGRKLLQYVVSETLAGRSGSIKAYTIAEDVFERKNFDAQNDPMVRIEAGRLRRELERYYLTAGPDEPVVLRIPKGSYVPTFEVSELCRQATRDGRRVEKTFFGFASALKSRAFVVAAFGKRGRLLMAAMAVLAVLAAGYISTGSEPSADFGIAKDGRPMIIVEPFEDIARIQSSVISRGLSEEIISKLIKFKDIVVVDGSAGNQVDIAKNMNPRYALQGSIREDGNRIRSIARLIRRSDGAVLWANNYDYNTSSASLFEIESVLAEQIATTVAQPFGVIFPMDTTPDNAGGWDAYDCSLSYYSYRRTMTAEALDTAQECLQAVTKKYPNDATSLAFLSLAILDRVRFSYKLGTQPSQKFLETSSELAKQAAVIDPQNARAMQAIMLTRFFQNDFDGALQAGAAAYKLNPNDTEVAGEYGLRLSMSGNWKTGCRLVSRAVSKSAGPQGFYEVGMALCAFMKGDVTAAEIWSRRSDCDYNPMHRLVLASILGASGKIGEAKREIAWLNAHAPALMSKITREVSMRLARPEDRERVLSGLRAAGAAVRPIDLSASLD